MGRPARSFIAIAVLLAAPACSGVIDDPRGAPASPPPSGPLVQPDGSFACNPGTAPSASPLRRLSARQYANTVRDLFGSALDVSAMASAEIARVPIDDAEYAIMDGRLSDLHVRAYYRVADRIATLVTTDDAALGALAGVCALDAAPEPTCVDAFLGDFGMRAFRRPLTSDERARYAALDDGTRDGRELFRAMIFLLLQAPQHLYHAEVDGSAIGGDVGHFALDAHALASRISYHFWQSMPDAELFASAEDGSLLTDAGYAAQVERVFSDPRTRDTIESFYREWWKVGWLTAFPDTPGFRTLAEGTGALDPGAGHLAAMNDEIDAMTAHFTFETGGTLRDLFLSDLSFTQSPELAALYGVEVWDGTGERPRMPAGERAGILTRAAFLVNDNFATHPIHRGVIVRRRILCDDLPQPDPASLPPDALSAPPVTADQTTRERYETKTANDTCNGCHQSMNPIGFVLESYDSLGRFRTEERVIDEATGEVLATLPIDSSAAPRLDPDDPTVIDSGVELSQMIADRGRAESCFARQYFRATFARSERASDGCVLERVRSTLASGGTLAEALRTIALDESFRARRVM